jgi:transcriptional regulator with XRE-family HTH domain
MRRRRLADARKAAGKTQEEIAEEVGVDRTTIGKWERDESTPHPNQRPAYAGALGITLSELDAMLSSMPSNGNDTPEWLSTYLGMEQSATEMRAHEPEVVYGLLQTPAYTDAVVRKVGLVGVPETYVEQAIQQRKHRQQRVRDGSLRLDVIQAEQTLRIRLGDAAVMAEQLGALADLAEQPNVTVRVTTFDAGQHEARRLDSFVIMSHPWGNPRVWVEGYGGGKFITDAEEVAYFASVFDQASRLALPPAESVGFIRKLASEWETRP